MPNDGALYTVVVVGTNNFNYTWIPLSPSGQWRAASCRIADYTGIKYLNKLFSSSMHRTLTIIAVLAVLLVAAQLHAQNLRDLPPRWMPEPPKICPPWIWCPPIRPPIWPPPLIITPIELEGYIYPIDPPLRFLFLSLAKYYIRTVDGRIYPLSFVWGAKFYLCGDFTNYVGTEKLVIVKGFVRHDPFPRPFKEVFATEVRDPAYPRCS